MNMVERFVATAGTVIGRDHVRLHKNNQDGLAIAGDADVIIAAVTDGCSSARNSEVGARLAAAWLARCAYTYAQGPTPEARADALAEKLLEFVSSVCFQMSPGNMGIDDLLHHYFLFTYLVCVMTPEETWIAGEGDGVFWVNGQTTVLDSGPDNAPRYPAYRLADPARLKDGSESMDGKPAVLWCGPTDAVESVILATDGARDLIARAAEPLEGGAAQGGLEQFAREARYVANPSLVQKRLVVIGEGNGRLRDDTTLVVIRRREMA